MTDKEHGNQNRFRGILTEADIEFLFGSTSELAESTIRDKRYRIRSRTQQAVKDFTHLDQGLSNKDVELLASNIYESDTSAMISLLSFAHRLNLSMDEEYDRYSDVDKSFGELIEVAIKNSAIANGQVADVDISITVEREDIDPESVLEVAIEDGISVDEMKYLRREGGYVDLLERVVTEQKNLLIQQDEEPDQVMTPGQAEKYLENIRSMR